MAHLITRRTALALGGSALVAGTAGAQIQTRPATPPNLPIERGATLRMLRPVRFVQPDEEVFRANCQRFTERTGVQVRVDFVGWEDITQQTAVTANTGAGPDIIIGFDQAPHIYADKIHDLTDIATYLGTKYGGWRPLARAYGMRQARWIGLPMGASGGPLIWRTSALREAGFETPPEDHAGFLRLCQALRRINKPAGFALGNAVGDGNAFANWLSGRMAASWSTRQARSAINSPQTINALTYLRELYQTFVPGTLAWATSATTGPIPRMSAS
jgi:multiple sugar transport system substrate-binding protein